VLSSSAATKVVITQSPATAAPGDDFAGSSQPKVEVQDADGNVVDSAVPVVLSLEQVGTELSGTLACDDLSVVPSSGTASFAGCAISRGGKYRFKATSTGLASDTSSDVFVSGAARVAFTSDQPNGGAAGAVWSAQPQLSVVDGNDVVLTSDTHELGVAILPGTGTAGAVLSCTDADRKIAAVDGVSTFAGCSIDKAGTGYKLVGVDLTDHVYGTSSAFAITAGTPTQIAFTVQPSGGAGGVALPTQPVVAVQDAHGNSVPGITHAITLALTSGSGTSGAALSCTAPVNAANGLATFSGCSVDLSGTAYTITATDSTISQTATSNPFTIGAGVATALSFSHQPSGGPAGAAFLTQPAVTLADAGGNAKSGTVTLSLTGGTAGAVLTCATNPQSAVNAPAAFTGCTVDRPGHNYRLHAVSGGLTGDSNEFDVAVGGVDSVVFTTSPDASTAGGASFAHQPVVQLLDAGGNPAAGSVTLSLTDGTGSPDAALGCANNTVTAVNGVATFSGCDVDLAATGYSLTATSGSVHGLSTRFDITTGAAARLRFVKQPGDGTGGKPLSTQPVVEVQDLGGNPIPGDDTEITLAVTPGTGDGSLTCSSNPQPVVRGAAAFQACAIDKTASNYRLTATDSTHHFSTTSDPFAVTPGPAAQLIFTATPKSAVAGQQFSTTPTVVVADKGGNPVTGSPSITLALTPGSGTPAGTLGCADLVQSDGTFEGCSISTAAGGYSLTATGAGRTAESPSFPVVQAPPVPLEQAPTAVPVAQTLGRLQYAKNPTAVADFVNSATGQLLWDTTDLTVAGVGKPLDLTRTYNSLDSAVGLFGQGWSSVLDLSVTFGPGSTTATVRGEDGQRVGFTLNPVNGTWVGAPGARATLKCSSKLCTVTRFDGTTWDVNGSQLLNYRDANGQGLTFGYTGGKLSSIKLASTNNSNRTVTVTTNAAGRVTKLQTPTRSVSYGYTGNLLTSFTDARSKTWVYGYTGGLLTTVTDPLGHDRLVVAYDGTTHRVSSLSAKGDPRHLQDTFAWDAGTQRSTRTATTSVDGALAQVDYVDTYKGNVLVRQDLPTGATMRYSHDAQLNLIAIQDPHGWVEQLTYSPANDLLQQSTPITSTSSANVQFTYDNQHRMLSQTDPNGNRTDYVFNGPNLGGVTPPGPGSIATKLVVDTKGLVTQMTNAIGKQLYSYDAFGNRTVVLEQSLPGAALNGKGTLSTYDEAGHQLTFVDARGTTRNQVNAFKSTWTYDAAGNLLSSVSPTSSSSQTYDDAGDIVASTDAAGVTSHFAWDEATLTRTTTTPTGTLTQVFDPSGNVLSEGSGGGGTTLHRYDGLGRETTTTSPAGIVTHLTYDGIGNVIGLKDNAGNTLTRQYDSRSLLIRQVDNGEDTRTTYDRVGNTTSYRDASGALTSRTYDPHNNDASFTDAAVTTSYAYDRADNVVSRTDGRGNTTTFGYDGVSRLLTTTTAGKTWTNSYDEAGSRVTTTDPDGRKTTLTLDAANRPTKTEWTQSGKPTITVTEAYNALGQRTAMNDGTTHHYTYDAAGRLTSGEGFTYAYDAGELTTTYPDGTHVVTTLDDTGSVMDVTSGTPGTAGYVRAAYLRDAARRTTGIAFANGILDSRHTDAAGNVLSDTLQRAGTTLASDVYSYDAGGNRLSQVHTAAGTKTTSTYGYDGANRLTGFRAVSEAAALPPLQTAVAPSASGGTISGGLAPPLPDPDEPTASGLPAPPTAYGYDAVGNRTSWATTGGTRTASHNTLDQAVTEGGAGGAATRTFDAAGNETKLVTSTFTRTSTYDAASRLISVVTTGAGAGTITYTYDGDGNRITRTTGGATTKLVWDKRSDVPQLVLETTSANALIRRYINGEGPVAMQTPTATFFFHLDPLGSTTELSDADGNVVAGYTYDGFGQVTTTGAGGATPPVNPLLFQGALLDSGSGLYYMHARDYDPTSGRFTRREPLSTPTGQPQVSPYAFVNDRPTVWTDPTGLTPLAERIFAGQASDDANIANNTKYAATGALIAVKAVAKLGGFAGAAKAAAAEGGVATTASKVGNGLKFAGVALAVIGLGLQTYVTVETCLHGTVQACVGATVGLAVSVGFFAGCTALTAGAGAVVCGIVGGVLSMALQFIITEYGPVIVDGLIEFGNLTAEAMTTAWLATAAAFTDFGNAIAQGTLAAIDGLVSGFNAGLAAVASGFQSALDVLVDAGYTAVQLATVLAETFEQGVREAIAGLIDLGYAIADLAETIKDVFNATALEAAQLFKDAFDYTATQVMAILDSAYDLAASAAAAIVKAVDYAVAQVGAALESVYNLAADAIAGVLKDVAYTVNQIGAVLKDVLHQADLALTQILKDLSYTVQQVAGVLRDVLAKVDQAAAALLQGVTFVATEIANALKDVYNAAIQRVGQVLKNIGVVVTQVATALASAFTAAAAAVAQVLKNIAYTVTQVGEALRDAFSQAAAVAVQVLQQIGYLATEVATALKDAFAQVDAAVASLLKGVGYLADQVASALQTVFTLGAQAVAQLLKNVNYLINEVAGALQSVFTATAEAAAQILKNIAYGISEIAGVLQSFFAEAAAAAAQILENIGYAFAEIGSVLQSVFNAAADAVVGILKDIGAAASEIATILGDVFGLAVDAIAGFLSDFFSSDTIAAIGGAFEDFGNAVADFFSDLF
jgi:RHS repeat-associated protein